VDNNGFVIAPIVVRPVNCYDGNLLSESLDELTDMADLLGLDLENSYLTLDSGFDSEYNKWKIKSIKMIPVIKPNRRGIKKEEKLEELYNNFNDNIYKERFKIERTFAWQDTYRKLSMRYEKLECIHTGFRYLAYSVMNLRGFMKAERRNSL
jgi:hypothetical protein